MSVEFGSKLEFRALPVWVSIRFTSHFTSRECIIEIFYATNHSILFLSFCVYLYIECIVSLNTYAGGNTEITQMSTWSISTN
jgi:hypothetical protein